MKPHPLPLPARLSYTDDDLLAYAHHVWVQYGMPSPALAWDEAKDCLARNLQCGAAGPVKRPRRPGPRYRLGPRVGPRS
jgi:hypothetical protein